VDLLYLFFNKTVLREKKKINQDLGKNILMGSSYGEVSYIESRILENIITSNQKILEEKTSVHGAKEI
jgi:hypothetical protein